MKKTLQNFKLLFLAVVLPTIIFLSCKKEETTLDSSLTGKRTSLVNQRDAILVNTDPPACYTLWPTWTYQTDGHTCWDYTWPQAINDTINVSWKIHPGLFWHKGNIRRLYPAYATSYLIMLDFDTLQYGSLPNIGTDFYINRNVTFSKKNNVTTSTTQWVTDTVTKSWHTLSLEVYFNNTTKANGNICAYGIFCAWNNKQ